MLLAAFGAEFVNECKHIPVVFAQQLPQVSGASGLRPFFGHHAGVGEVLVNLIIQLVAVGDHHKRPVAGYFAQDFLR